MLTISSATKAKIGAVLGVLLPIITSAAAYFNAGTLPTLATLGTVSGAVTLAWGILHAANSAPTTTSK